MPALRAICTGLFTSSIFIALCAVALSLETSVVTGLPYESVGFYVFVFLATLSSYRVHAFVAQPTLARRNSTAAIVLITGIAALFIRPAMLPWLGLAAIASVAYSLPTLPGGKKLREYGIAKILVLVSVWTLVTAYLPMLGKLHGDAMLILLARRFLFMFALCLAFDLRDHVADARAGIRTVPVRVGVESSYSLARFTLIAFAGLILFTPLEQSAFTTVALLLSAAITWFAIEQSRRRVPGDLYYLGWIDGMMAVQGLLVVAAKWLSTGR